MIRKSIETYKTNDNFTFYGFLPHREIVSHRNEKFEIMDANPLHTSHQQVQNNKNEGIKKLTIHIEGQAKTTIAVEYKEMNNRQMQVIKQLVNW